MGNVTSNSICCTGAKNTDKAHDLNVQEGE